MPVKSWITRPTDETGTVKAGNVQIVGVAMGGMKKVRSVKVSIDGGQSWKKAKFVGPDLGKYAWRQFVLEANLAPEITILQARLWRRQNSTRAKNGK